MKRSATKNLLIIFVKNTDLGHVKTRLAKTVGDEMALAIYKELLVKTQKEVSLVDAERAVFYSTYIDEHDNFVAPEFNSHVQFGADLGERMMNAFEMAFNNGFEKVIIIGSDCYDLSHQQIEEAFHHLEKNDFVFGPAEDGGYYLMGMSSFFTPVFENKEWSTENVLSDSIIDVKKAGKSYYLIDTLSDVDHFSDLPEELKRKFGLND